MQKSARIHLTILTGASRGLGHAIGELRLASGHCVLAIARSPIALPVPKGAELISWHADLAIAEPVAVRLLAWLAARDADTFASATLINNAGVMSPLFALSDGHAPDLTNALRVGLEAPLLLTAAFLKATANWIAPRKVLLISSGLGRRPMAGGAAYCAVKAGLDHLARTVALEEAARPNGARIVSLAPGIIETAMQVQIRASDSAGFPERDRFVSLKAEGLIDMPALAAAKVLKALDHANFGIQPVAHVLDLQ